MFPSINPLNHFGHNCQNLTTRGSCGKKKNLSFPLFHLNIKKFPYGHDPSLLSPSIPMKLICVRSRKAALTLHLCLLRASLWKDIFLLLGLLFRWEPVYSHPLEFCRIKFPNILTIHVMVYRWKKNKIQNCRPGEVKWLVRLRGGRTGNQVSFTLELESDRQHHWWLWCQLWAMLPRSESWLCCLPSVGTWNNLSKLQFSHL